MVWNIILSGARSYAPWIMLPVTVTVGFIGYNLEWAVRSSKPVEAAKSTQEQREERRLKEVIKTS